MNSKKMTDNNLLKMDLVVEKDDKIMMVEKKLWRQR